MTGEELFYGVLAMGALCVWWVVSWIGGHVDYVVRHRRAEGGRR